MKKKIIALALGCTVAFGCAVGGTLAWLTDDGGTVTNTFTTSDINITLEETQGGDNKEFKMVPGHTIAKDPKVTVKAGSEPCYVFVKIKEAGGDVTYTPAGETDSKTTVWSDWLTYGIRLDDSNTDDVDGWTELTVDANGDALTGVYYWEVTDLTADWSKYVLAAGTGDNANGYVTVKDTVTKEMMNGTGDKPTLTFTAAAVQLYETNGAEFTPAKAYAQVKWPTN